MHAAVATLSAQPNSATETTRDPSPSMQLGSLADTAQAEQFIRKWQAGEKTAAREFYFLYKDRIYRWAFVKTRNSHAAQDLCQEVWHRIHRSLLTYRPGTSPNAWVYKILLNTHRSLWRRGQRIFENILEYFLDEGEAKKGSFAASLLHYTPESLLAQKQELTAVLDALHEIPEAFRSVVILRIVEELPIEEMASILDLSEGTVKSRLNRGVEKLREQLGLRMAPHQRVKR